MNDSEQWKSIVEEVYFETMEILERFKKDQRTFDSLSFFMAYDSWEIFVYENIGNEDEICSYGSLKLYQYIESLGKSLDYQALDKKLHIEIPKAYKKLLHGKQFHPISKGELFIDFVTEDYGSTAIGKI